MSPVADLHGLPMLLTRPKGQGEDWQASLSNLGAQVTHIPTLLISPLPPPEETESLLKSAHIGIFVSGNAVTSLAKIHGAAGYPIAWYCVGQATQALARSLGFKVVDSKAYNSESLLEHADLAVVNGLNCLIVRGVGGRETLGNALLARGAQVNYCELYRRDLASQNAAVLADYLSRQPADKPNIISIGSVDTLKYTLLLAKQGEQGATALRSTWLVPGERVALAAAESGVRSVLQTQSMQLADIVYILNKWWADQR